MNASKTSFVSLLLHDELRSSYDACQLAQEIASGYDGFIERRCSAFHFHLLVFTLHWAFVLTWLSSRSFLLR